MTTGFEFDQLNTQKQLVIAINRLANAIEDSNNKSKIDKQHKVELA